MGDNSVKKARLLYQKGMDCYNDNSYEEALKYFQASINLDYTEKAEKYIKLCKNKIPKKTSQNNYSSYNNSNTTNNNYTHSNTKQNSTNRTKTPEDIECENVINKKDYYEILGVPKTASTDELKKAYKKKAIKFHPDKNKSKKAEEAFKKISQAYQVLNDPEKRKLFDQYGTEEEVREKYYQQHHQNFYDEGNQFDFFEMFMNGEFGGAFGRPNRGGQRQEARPVRPIDNLIRLLPFLIIILVYLLPNFMENSPLYQFSRSREYSHKKTTKKNQVEYFVNDKFIKQYPKMIDIQRSGIEKEIETNYLYYVAEQCKDLQSMRRQLEYRMNSPYTSSYDKRYYQQKLSSMNYKPCYRYQELANKIR